jgi:hypothetical protein
MGEARILAFSRVVRQISPRGIGGRSRQGNHVAHGRRSSFRIENRLAFPIACWLYELKGSADQAYAQRDNCETLQNGSGNDDPVPVALQRAGVRRIS